MGIIAQEEWKAIIGFDGYEISNFGGIRSLDRIVPGNKHQPGGCLVKGRILKPFIANGYYKVKIHGKHLYIHRYVATTFIGPIPDGYEVNHDDGNKLNCRFDNLEITTPLGNITHAIATGLMDNRGESHGMAKLTDQKVVDIRAIEGKSLRDIAKESGMSLTTIHNIRKRKSWKHV